MSPSVAAALAITVLTLAALLVPVNGEALMASWLRTQVAKRREQRAEHRWREHEVTALVSFLRARYDEDERAARAAVEELATDPRINWPENADQWAANFIYMTDTGYPTDYSVWFDQDCDATVVNVGTHREAVGTHIARQDPRATLLDIEAKEKILWLAESAVKSKVDAVHVLALWSLRALASAFPDHDDFCDRWKL